MQNLPDENSKRFVAVLNKKIETGRLMNALGHMTAGLVGGYGDPGQFCFLEYEDKDGGTHSNISHFPFIVLQADNSNKIRAVRNEAIKRNIPFTDFTSSMILGTSEEQLRATKETAETDLEYYGICLFGDTIELKEFTGKFSLFRN
jgi:hypothetical protein